MRVLEGSDSYLDRWAINDGTTLREDLLLVSKQKQKEGEMPSVNVPEGGKGRRSELEVSSTAQRAQNTMY